MRGRVRGVSKTASCTLVALHAGVAPRVLSVRWSAEHPQSVLRGLVRSIYLERGAQIRDSLLMCAVAQMEERAGKVVTKVRGSSLICV